MFNYVFNTIHNLYKTNIITIIKNYYKRYYKFIVMSIESLYNLCLKCVKFFLMDAVSSEFL